MATKTGLGEKIKALNGQGAGLGTLRQCKVIYNFAKDGGAISTLTPLTSIALPKNAVIVGGVVNPTTAAASLGSATVAVGTSAGSSTTSILAATAVASLGANALVPVVPTLAVPVRLTAKGYVTVTIATAALTAGIIEITLWYYVGNA